MKYRKLTAILAVAMAFTVLVSCGKDDSSEEVSQEESSQSVTDNSETEGQSELDNSVDEIASEAQEEYEDAKEGIVNELPEPQEITLPAGYEQHHYYSFQVTAKATVNGQSQSTVFVLVEDSDTKPVSKYDVIALAQKVAGSLESDTYRFNFYPQGTAAGTTSEPFAVVEMDANGNMTLVSFTEL